MEREYYENGKPIVPFLPYYCSNGNLVIRMWDEPFEDRNGNKAMLTKLVYKDKKGKISDEIVSIVRWV